MSIILIAAIGKNNEIGQDNTLPWSLPEDLQHFKKTTLHKKIIMGRKPVLDLNALFPTEKIMS